MIKKKEPFYIEDSTLIQEPLQNPLCI